MNLKDSITTLKGIGEKTKEKLYKLNIYTIEDLLFFYPRDFEDRSNIMNICDVYLEEKNLIRAIVAKEPEVLNINGKTILKVVFRDKTHFITAVWFNQQYLKNLFQINKEFYLYGKVTEKFNKLQIDSPEYCNVNNEKMLSIGRIVPIYNLVSGLSQNNMRKYVYQCLDVIDEIKDCFSEEFLKTYNLLDLKTAIKNIHYPISNEMYAQARKRLVFDEIFIVQYCLHDLKMFAKLETNKYMANIQDEAILKKLKFELTKAQKRVLNDIKKDFGNKFAMNRLIQGDVGSGKTAVALVASFIAIQNGYQVALMAPTEVLAKQHYEEIKEILKDFNIQTSFLSGSMKAKEKRESLENIKNNKSKMIIGTHAVIQDKVEFSNLGLVITDEQHRFGVKQRMQLANKGEAPHTIVMTATPIPRTLALILHGDLDISIIDELPPGRQKIDTFAVNNTYKERIYNFIKKEVAQGRQCYIICPLVEESEKAKGKAVIEYTEELKETYLKDINIAYLHGKMKNDEKVKIMNEFVKNNISVLISTTVIEVGINVPNSTLIIIEDADKFGLAQLHQLRGRVGRGSEKSYCILISDKKSKTTKERLNAMCNTTDGFVLSEKDLELRGPGDFFGTRQHGLPEFKIANMFKDLKTVSLCQKIIDDIHKEKIYLKEEEKKLIKKQVNNYMDIVNNTISL